MTKFPSDSGVDEMMKQAHDAIVVLRGIAASYAKLMSDPGVSGRIQGQFSDLTARIVGMIGSEPSGTHPSNATYYTPIKS